MSKNLDNMKKENSNTENTNNENSNTQKEEEKELKKTRESEETKSVNNDISEELTPTKKNWIEDINQPNHEESKPKQEEPRVKKFRSAAWWDVYKEQTKYLNTGMTDIYD